MILSLDQTVGETVAQDYRAASVFRTNGIDFCCKGGRSIRQACAEKGIAPETLLAQLQTALTAAPSAEPDYRAWPLDLLADYVVKKHHRYVQEKLPELLQYLDKLCKAHGERHPELFEIREEFGHVADELAAHMQKEEHVLFPYVSRLATERQPPRPPFGTVENPIRMMMHEHPVEGDRFARIAKLTDEYTPPADACATYRVAFALLREFEEDLHQHIHLENNIMFPRAIESEKNAFA